MTETIEQQMKDLIHSAVNAALEIAAQLADERAEIAQGTSSRWLHEPNALNLVIIECEDLAASIRRLKTDV